MTLPAKTSTLVTQKRPNQNSELGSRGCCSNRYRGNVTVA
jgi:hypothetical protein